MDWKARQRKYDLEKRWRNNLKKEVVGNHPLKTALVSKLTATTKPDISNKIINHKESKSEFVDPLSRFAAEASVQYNEKSQERNEASNGILVNDLADDVSTMDEKTSRDDGFETWSQKQSQILSTFTTSQKLSLVALSSKKEVATKMLPSSVTEKVKTRLEQLDELEEGFEHETLSLTQEEYVDHINKLGSSLIAAWKEDQRVKTLKIVIQCAKLLGDTSSKQFYPSKFVIISEILENFGRLVFERLLEKATSSLLLPGQRRIISISDIDPDLISDVAKETCRNWFYKIASIRELLPRIYVEASVLRCLDFLEPGAAERSLDGLVAMTRGVAEPLVGTYLRCYLARVGDSLYDTRIGGRKGSSKMPPAVKPSSAPNPFVLCSKMSPISYLIKALNDTLTPLNSPPYCLENANKTKGVESEGAGVSRCLVPAFEWIVRCLARAVVRAGLPFDRFEELFEMSRCCKDRRAKQLVVGCAIDHLPHSFVAERAAEIKDVISALDGSDEEISRLYAQLGRALAKGSGPPESDRRPLLNEVWRVVTSFDRPRDYMNCAGVWAGFVARHFGRKEVNVVMGDVVRKLTPDRAFEVEQTSLSSAMGHFLDCPRVPLVELVSLSNFLPFLDIMEGETKSSVCKDVLQRFSRLLHERRMSSDAPGDDVVLSDPVTVHSFVTVCKHLHDRVSVLSADDEVRLIGRLISNLVGMVRRGSDSSQLEFYVECRANFCNIDPVLIDLVHRVNRLATGEGPSSSGGGFVVEEDGAFLRACGAYCFITVPSLNGVFHRLNLYLASGLVALRNGCLPQADSFLASAVRLIPEVPRLLEMDGKVVHTEGMLSEFVSNLCSGLLVLPDPPNRPPLFHLRELLSAVESYPWDARFDARLSCYCSLLLCLSCQSQQCLPYRIPGVDSNDALYGSDPKFLAEVDSLSSEILSRISAYLERLDGAGGARAAEAAASVVDRLLCHSELPACVPFFKTLWSFLRSDKWKATGAGGNSPEASVSANVSRIIGRVERLASEEPLYDEFLSLMTS